MIVQMMQLCFKGNKSFTLHVYKFNGENL